MPHNLTHDCQELLVLFADFYCNLKTELFIVAYPV